MGIVFGLMLAGLGLFMLGRGLVEFRTAKASQNWPSAEGEIVLAMVHAKVSSDEDGTSTKYVPHVVYKYSVLGEQYSSDQVTIGAKRNYVSQAKAEAKLQYQSGDQVTVYHNPDNPAQAVLESGAVGGTLGTLLMGLVITVVGGFVLSRTI